jgi:hypothetical protein
VKLRRDLRSGEPHAGSNAGIPFGGFRSEPSFADGQACPGGGVDIHAVKKRLTAGSVNTG